MKKRKSIPTVATSEATLSLPVWCAAATPEGPFWVDEPDAWDFSDDSHTIAVRTHGEREIGEVQTIDGQTITVTIVRIDAVDLEAAAPLPSRTTVQVFAPDCSDGYDEAGARALADLLTRAADMIPAASR